MVEMKCRPLAERRRLNRIVFMYKVLKGYVAVPMDRVDLILNPWPPTLGKTKKQLKHLARKTPQYEHSFAFRTIIQWNTLPNSVTASVAVPSFRHAVAAHQAPSDHSGCTQILPRYPLEIVNHKTRQAHYFLPSLLPSASPYCPYSPNIIFTKLFGNSIVGKKFNKKVANHMYNIKWLWMFVSNLVYSDAPGDVQKAGARSVTSSVTVV